MRSWWQILPQQHRVHTKEAQNLYQLKSPLSNPNFLNKSTLNVNTVKQDLLHKKQFLKILWSEAWKEGFQLMLILVLLGMYFDAVVVFVTSQSLLFRLALAILWYYYRSIKWSIGDFHELSIFKGEKLWHFVIYHPYDTIKLKWMNTGYSWAKNYVRNRWVPIGSSEKYHKKIFSVKIFLKFEIKPY